MHAVIFGMLGISDEHRRKASPVHCCCASAEKAKLEVGRDDRDDGGKAQSQAGVADLASQGLGVKRWSFEAPIGTAGSGPVVDGNYDAPAKSLSTVMTVTGGTALCDIGHFGAPSAEIPPQPRSCWCHVNCSFALMAGRAGNSAGLVAYLERVAMRNALGLMLASVLAAVVIAGGWYFYFLARRRRRPQDNSRPCRRSAAGTGEACRQG